MRQHRTEKFITTPWRFPVAAEEVAESGDRFALVADDETRAEIARIAGLRDLPRLQADFEVTRQDGRGLRVAGTVSATVGQTCVVTLEPLRNEVEEAIDLVFMPQAAALDTIGDHANDLAESKPEPLVDGVVDLGALATEFLILGIDPYPRKPGAVFEAPSGSEQDAGPFAALEQWTKSRNDH